MTAVATIVDRDRTVALLRGEFEALSYFCRTLTPDQWSAPSSLPGWTLHDVLAHIVGTESMLSGTEAPAATSRDADSPQLDYVHNPIGEANEIWVQSMRGWSDEQLLAGFEEVTARRLEALDAMDQADFDAPSWTPAGRDETYGRFMRIRHFDCFMHEHDMRLAIRAEPRNDAADLDFCLDEVVTGLGYIVGRRAALPDGSRVRIELTGPAARTLLVTVDGRASVTEKLDGPATVEVTMPAPLFLRLTGGREDPDSGALGTVEIGGDRQLGEQLVAKLAFTI